MTIVLSRSADHLYWMARSMERAENTARMLDVTYRMSLLKQMVAEPHHEWRAMLSISGLHEDFEARYDEPSADNVMHFMALDDKNPGSIYNSIFTARENARAIRGSITSEMWEALNATWLEMHQIQTGGIAEDGVARFFEGIGDDQRNRLVIMVDLRPTQQRCGIHAALAEFSGIGVRDDAQNAEGHGDTGLIGFQDRGSCKRAPLKIMAAKQEGRKK